MDEEQRDERGNPSADQPEPNLPFESIEIPPAEEELVWADELAGPAAPPEPAVRVPDASELLAREIEGLKQAPPLESNLRIEPSAGDSPLPPYEAIFGQPPATGTLNVDFQPHARRVPIAYEPQPSFETPEDVAASILRGPDRPEDKPLSARHFLWGRDEPVAPQQVQYSHSQPAQVSATQSSAGGEATDGPHAPDERGQALPRLLVTVSMANARSIFQECIERASKTLGAKFHSACQSTVNEYARERRAAERAANRWG